MPNFFSDNPNSGDDLKDMMDQAPKAIMAGYKIGTLLVMPLLALGRLLQKRAEANVQGSPPPPPSWTPPQFPPLTPPDPDEEYRRTLGVPLGASKEQIKERYRFLSHAYHPDKFPEGQRAQAEEEFKRLNEAYQVLTKQLKPKVASPQPNVRPSYF